MTSKQITQALEQAIRRIFKPLVRILLRNGISFSQFAEMAKRVYVEVATEEFTIPGKRQTTSRVATITGLTRKEVQRTNNTAESEGESERLARYNRAARVITAWATQQDYLDAAGEPLILSLNGQHPSFTSLVKTASGDITARTILDELVHVGAVARLEDGGLQLLTRAYIPDGDDAEKIAILGTDVADLIATIDHNLRADKQHAYFQRKVCYNNLPEEVMEELRAVIVSKAQAALEEMNAEMNPCDRDSNPKQRGSGQVRAGLGIYYFEHRDKRR